MTPNASIDLQTGLQTDLRGGLGADRQGSNPDRGAKIDFCGITKRFGNVVALDALNLEIPAGEFVTLLGPSGSGKTTVLNILAGFETPSEGHVRISGRDVTRIAPEHRRLGMVFQNYALFPHMNVLENVAFPLRMQGVARSERNRLAAATLEKVHLSGLETRAPSALSGGQKQRVALARALVIRPSVLLMDECLSALDLKLRETMQREIKALHRELGCTVLFVTHDQGEALGLSDTIGLMRDGRLEQVGTPQEIYDFPAGSFAAEFIGKANVLDVVPDGKTIEVPDLTLSFPVPDWPRSALQASIRPEVLHRGNVLDGSFEATVTGILFLGEMVEYSLRTKTGFPLIYREVRPPEGRIASIGDAVTLSLAAKDIVPLASASSHPPQSKRKESSQ